MAWTLTKWKVATASAALLSCPVLVAGLMALTDRDSITREVYDQVQLGMTRGDVEKLLGSPGRGISEDSRPPEPKRTAIEMVEEGPFDNRPDDNEPGRRMMWDGRDSGLMLRFGPGDRVTDKMLIRLAPVSLFERVWFWVGH